jgi:predicted DNA binding protein
MQSCLGIYIEENLIKYAKVQREKDNIKVESFGTKFYENIEQAINQIVAETNSTKIPISINLSKEQYDYFQVFALLNKPALKKSMEIEFEMLCGEKGIDKDSMERRYIFVLNPEDPDKMKAINVSVAKNELENKKELFSKYNLSNIEPLPISIMNLIKNNKTQNELIVNMEEETTLTFIENGQISQIDKIQTNINEALTKISQAENSETKAYELLKNTTISSQEMDSVQEGNEYIEIIVPVLFNMLNEIKEKIASYGKPIKKIYFSGTGIVINNVDMYFQDRLNEIECEILKPSFINSQSLKIGIKDYIE